MENGDAEGAVRRLSEAAPGAVDLRASKRAALLLPRADGVQAADDETLGAVGGLGLAPDALELVERPREAPRRELGDVVVARHDQERRAERAEQAGRVVVLGRRVAVREVAADDDELGRGRVDERAQIPLDLRLLLRSCVEIRQLQDAYGRHRTGRL